MARGASVWDLIFVGHRWRYKGKRVRSHLHVRNCRLDFRHVTGDATASRRSFFVMGVLLDGAGARTIQRKRTVAIQAQLVRRLSQLRVIIRTMHVVAAKARHSAPVHYTLHEIIALHAVLVRCAVRIVRERCLTQRVFLKLPKIPQI